MLVHCIFCIAERWFISHKRGGTGYSSTIQEEQLRGTLLGGGIIRIINAIITTYLDNFFVIFFKISGKHHINVDTKLFQHQTRGSK